MMRYLIILLFSFSAYGQGPMYKASLQQAAGGCTPDPDEIHTQSNAVSDPNCNEANATTGWSQTGATFTSVSTDPQSGSYHFSVVSGNGSSDRAEYSFSAVSGNTYRVTLRAKALTGTDARIATWVGLSTSPNTILTSTWTDYEFNVTATATGTAIIRIYAAQSTGSAGDTTYFDNFSLVNTTP